MIQRYQKTSSVKIRMNDSAPSILSPHSTSCRLISHAYKRQSNEERGKKFRQTVVVSHKKTPFHLIDASQNETPDTAEPTLCQLRIIFGKRTERVSAGNYNTKESAYKLSPLKLPFPDPMTTQPSAP